MRHCRLYMVWERERKKETEEKGGIERRERDDIIQAPLIALHHRGQSLVTQWGKREGAVSPKVKGHSATLLHPLTWSLCLTVSSISL